VEYQSILHKVPKQCPVFQRRNAIDNERSDAAWRHSKRILCRYVHCGCPALSHCGCNCVVEAWSLPCTVFSFSYVGITLAAGMSRRIPQVNDMVSVFCDPHSWTVSLLSFSRVSISTRCALVVLLLNCIIVCRALLRRQSCHMCSVPSHW
jgi:hypothetical protein